MAGFDPREQPGHFEEERMESGNIVERLRELAMHLDDVPREKIEDELLEAAEVIERLRAELNKVAPIVASEAPVKI
jgi:hypothetical protein